jgi:TPR repeat protein
MFLHHARKAQMNIADLRKKAESGNIAAQTILGVCYLDGTDVEVDYKEAFRLLSAAAEQGAPRALVNLARMHADGLGVPKNVPEAIPLYEGAASAGEFLAQVALGRLYSRGDEIPANPVAALRWYSAAVAQQHRVGDCEELQEAKGYVAKAAK